MLQLKLPLKITQPTAYTLYNTHPVLNESASLRNAELMRIGKGKVVNKLGKRMIASHCSPTFCARKPVET